MTLLTELESSFWSEEALDLFELLARYKPSDEGALIVICAAAFLLSRRAQDEDSLFMLIDEFGELAERLGSALLRPAPLRPGPRLELVGGRDAKG